MSRETETMFKAFQEFTIRKGEEPKNEEEFNQLFEEFMQEYNSNLTSDLPRQKPQKPQCADDCLELAYDAATSKEALAYAKKALTFDKECIDAETMVAELSAKDDDDMQKKYLKIIKKAETRLREDGLFEEDCIGRFWGILETRPYMRARHAYIEHLLQLGKFRKAAAECEDMLTLCENDNLGIRYHLMHLYAFYEDELSAMKLYKRYSGAQNTLLLLPLIVLYYKMDNYEQAKKYLKQLRSINPDTENFFLHMEDEELDDLIEDVAEIGAYQGGTASEFVVSITENDFLYLSTDGVMDWIARNLKKLK